MKRALVILAGVAAVVILPLAATAHNAGHIFLADGTCRDLGSFGEAPLVGQDRTQLDLIPSTPRDEFGVSFVGVSGGTPILPGGCPQVLTGTAIPNDSPQLSETFWVTSSW